MTRSTGETQEDRCEDERSLERCRRGEVFASRSPGSNGIKSSNTSRRMLQVASEGSKVHQSERGRQLRAQQQWQETISGKLKKMTESYDRYEIPYKAAGETAKLTNLLMHVNAASGYWGELVRALNQEWPAGYLAVESWTGLLR
jgi:hypothetical protein